VFEVTGPAGIRTNVGIGLGQKLFRIDFLGSGLLKAEHAKYEKQEDRPGHARHRFTPEG
jgi:hypothetical protein